MSLILKVAAFIDFQGTLGGEGIDDMVASDMVLAKNIGAKGILVLTGVGKSSLNEYRYTWKDVEAHYIAENVLEAAKWIINDIKNYKNNLIKCER